MGKTLYQKLQNTKAKHCDGKATKADVTTAANAYVKDAVSKGRTKAEAEKSAKRVVNSGCSISGVKKKRSTTKGKSKAGRPRKK